MSAPAVEFRNLVGYIKATDTSTKVSSWFNKNNVIFQAVDNGSNDAFMVKSDTYMKYYKWSDVAIPKRPDIATLLAQLTLWAGEQEMHLYEDKPNTVMQVKPLYDTASMDVDEVRNDTTDYPVGTGSLANEAGFTAALGSRIDASAKVVWMRAPCDSASPGPSGSGAGGRIARQTKQYAPSPADKRMVALVTARLVDPGSLPARIPYSSATPASMAALKGSVFRAGVFDDANDVRSGFGKEVAGNGVFVEFGLNPDRNDWATDREAQRAIAAMHEAGDAAGKAAYIQRWKNSALWVVFRTAATGSQEDVRFPQFSWNMDRLFENDGSVFDVDPFCFNTFVFQYSASPGIDTRFGVMHGSIIHWVHTWDTTDEPYRMATSSLPIRWEVDNRFGTSNVEMVAGSAIVSCDGDHDVPGRPVSFDTHIVTKELVRHEQTPLVSFRLSPERNRGALHPMRLSLLNKGASGTCKYELRLNPTLTSATWTAGDSYTFDIVSPIVQDLSDTGTSRQVDTAAAAVSGGVTLVSGFLFDAVVRDISVDFSLTQLHAAIDGTPDVLTVVVTLIAGTVDVAASLQFLEKD